MARTQGRNTQNRSTQNRSTQNRRTRGYGDYYVDGKVKALRGAQLDNALSEMNEKMSNSEAIFGIHEKTNRVMIKIIDKTTKEVIKEYPPEETLDMIAKVWEIAGIMVDEKR